MQKYCTWWFPGTQSVSLQMGKGKGEGQGGEGGEFLVERTAWMCGGGSGWIEEFELSV